MILEDDCDWDVRIRQQLQDFAASTNALTQPLANSPSSFADSTFPAPAENAPNLIPEIEFESLPVTLPPEISPYGDNWDLLWVGHCGVQVPFEDNKKVPRGRVIHRNDVTVPEKHHLWSLNSPFTLTEQYPQHTRSVHHLMEGVCSLGYAVSRRGAQKLLHEIGLKGATDAFDILLRFYCEGTRGRSVHNCLTTDPGLFQHHRAPGPLKDASDIGNHGEGFRSTAMTDMIRWSVRMNSDVLLKGGTDFIDQFPDTQTADKAS